MRFNRFLAIRTEGNLAYLDKAFDGTDTEFKSHVPVPELMETWEKIDNEYTELMDSGVMKDTLGDTLDMNVLEGRFLLITKTVEALKIVYDEAFVEILEEEGVTVNLDPTNPEKYYKALNRIVTLSKTLVVESKIKEAQIKSRLENVDRNNDVESTDEGDNLRDILNAIRADMNHHVPEDGITVYDFAWMYKRLLKKLKAKPNG